MPKGKGYGKGMGRSAGVKVSSTTAYPAGVGKRKAGGKKKRG